MRMRWLVAIACVAVLAVVSIAIAAGGGDDVTKTQQGTNLNTIRCPLAPTGKTGPDGQPEYKPAENAFDTAELLDLPVEEARTRAAKGGCEIVVSIQDGAGQPVPIDLNPKLIYVYTEKGRVTQIEGVGGGI